MDAISWRSRRSRWDSSPRPQLEAIAKMPHGIASPDVGLFGNIGTQRTAMDGRNLFKSRWMESFGSKSASAGPHLGVFISHSRLDKEKAREVADALEASQVDYYFDENDAELQLADEHGDHLKVVQCIENGLSVCSHLLGIITENTKDSWWVPYEIGSATGRAQACAHLIDEEVTQLPSYIQAARILANRDEMREWLPSETKKTASASHLIVELSKALAVACDYPSFIPTNRRVSDLTFY